MKIVVTRKADLGAAGERVLEQKRGGVGRRLLVQRHAHVAGAAVGYGKTREQHRIGLHGKLVGGIRRRVHADMRDALHRDQAAVIGPRRAIEKHQRRFVDDIRHQSGERRIEAPAAIGAIGDPAILPRPRAGGRGFNKISVAIGGR